MSNPEGERPTSDMPFEDPGDAAHPPEQGTAVVHVDAIERSAPPVPDEPREVTQPSVELGDALRSLGVGPAQDEAEERTDATRVTPVPLVPEGKRPTAPDVPAIEPGEVGVPPPRRTSSGSIPAQAEPPTGRPRARTSVPVDEGDVVGEQTAPAAERPRATKPPPPRESMLEMPAVAPRATTKPPPPRASMLEMPAVAEGGKPAPPAPDRSGPRPALLSSIPTLRAAGSTGAVRRPSGEIPVPTAAERPLPRRPSSAEIPLPAGAEKPPRRPSGEIPLPASSERPPPRRPSGEIPVPPASERQPSPSQAGRNASPVLSTVATRKPSREVPVAPPVEESAGLLGGPTEPRPALPEELPQARVGGRLSTQSPARERPAPPVALRDANTRIGPVPGARDGARPPADDDDDAPTGLVNVPSLEALEARAAAKKATNVAFEDMPTGLTTRPPLEELELRKAETRPTPVGDSLDDDAPATKPPAPKVAEPAPKAGGKVQRRRTALERLTGAFRALGSDEHGEELEALRRSGAGQGLRLMVGGGMILVGVALFGVFVVNHGDRPSQNTLELLYPFGFHGQRMPSGKTAPGADRLKFDYVTSVECGESVCVRYRVHTEDDSFEIHMNLKNDGDEWKLESWQ